MKPIISGVFSAVVSVQILPTNLTKLAELFTFTLTSVDPPGLASLKPDATQINFTLPDIGNPGGVFSFGLDMNASYIVQVSYLQKRLFSNNFAQSFESFHLFHSIFHYAINWLVGLFCEINW